MASNVVLGPRRAYATATAPYLGVALGDLNNDGHLDVVTADSGDTVSVLLNSGSGILKAYRAYKSGSGAESPVLGDVNGDGYLDVVTADWSGSSVSVLLGSGNGDLGNFVSYADSGNTQKVMLGDMNGDGHLDAVAASYNSRQISVLLGSGNGAFGVRSPCSVTGRPVAVGLGDLNGDGFLDVVTSNSDNNGGTTMSVLFGLGDGTLRASASYAAGSATYSIVVSDLNGDGYADVVMADLSASTVSIFLGSVSGVLGARKAYTVGASPYDIALGDLNKDGYLDVVTADYNDNTVSVLLGLGNGALALRTIYATGTGPQGVALGDLNGDGYLDVITSDHGASTVSVFLNVPPTTTTTATTTTTTNSILLMGTIGNDLFTATPMPEHFVGNGGEDTVSYANSNAAVVVNLEVGQGLGGYAAQDVYTGISDLVGSGYNDTLMGNSQNNVLEGKGGADILDGGDGNDTVSYKSSPSAVTVNLTTKSVSHGDAEGDTITNFENIIGSAFDDTLVGGTGPNTLILGGAGNDNITGGSSGTSILYGEEGTDVFAVSASSSGTIVVIKDFDLSNHERMDLTSFTNLHRVGDLSIQMVTGDTHIRLPGTEIVLEKIQASALTDSNFIFTPESGLDLFIHIGVPIVSVIAAIAGFAYTIHRCRSDGAYCFKPKVGQVAKVGVSTTALELIAKEHVDAASLAADRSLPYEPDPSQESRYAFSGELGEDLTTTADLFFDNATCYMAGC